MPSSAEMCVSFLCYWKWLRSVIQLNDLYLSLECCAPETKDCKICKGQRILERISWKEKGSLEGGTACCTVLAERESDGFCNGIDMFLQILASGLCFSGVCSSGLITTVGEECKEQEMALSFFFFFKGEIRIWLGIYK